MPTDLTVELSDNRPGAYASVAEALGGAGVNIEGGAMIEGTVHVLVNDARKAADALRAAGLSVESEREALVVDLQDRPGTLAQTLRAIADAGINVSFVYVGTDTRAVIGAEDVAGARAALGG